MQFGAVRRGQARARAVEALRVGEQVGQHLLRRQDRPQSPDRRLHFRVGLHLVADLGQVGAAEQTRSAGQVRAHGLGELIGQRVDDRGREDRAGQVVRAARGAGPAARLGGDLSVEGDRVAVEGQRDRLRRDLLPVADRLFEHLQDRRGPFDLPGPQRVLAGRLHARIQIADGGQQHAGLAEGGQHLADVVEEGGVGADDQHARLGQLLAEGVEQVGGAVQRHGRLAGAGTALHDQHALVLGADDRVLLALDGLHDVVHVAGARGVERGQQRALAAHAARVLDGARATGGGQVQVFVVDRRDPPVAGAQVPAPDDAVRRGGGGQVERPGQRGAPVQQQRFVVVFLVEDAEPADVAALAVAVGGVGAAVQIDAPEAQAVLGGIVFGQVLGVELGERLAFGAGLRGAAGLQQHRRQAFLGVGAHLVESLVEQAQVRLLVGQVGVGVRRPRGAVALGRARVAVAFGTVLGEAVGHAGLLVTARGCATGLRARVKTELSSLLRIGGSRRPRRSGACRRSQEAWVLFGRRPAPSAPSRWPVDLARYIARSASCRTASGVR